MMELERRLSGAQDGVTAANASLAALAALVDGLSLNYGYGDSGGGFTTTSTTYVDITSVTCSITTTGGPLLMIIAGGGLSNQDFQRYAYVGIQVNGITYGVTNFFQNITGSGDDVFVPLAGMYVKTGLPAGAYTVNGRLKTDAAGGTAQIDGDSQVSIFALELTL